MALLVYLTPAIRVAGWDRTKRQRFVIEILEAVQEARSDDIANSSGRHILRYFNQHRYLVVGNHLDKHPAVPSLAAKLFVMGELAFGINHRLLIESHGPYSYGKGLSAIVRSVFPAAIVEHYAAARELSAVSTPPSFHLVTWFASFTGPAFDMFGNLILKTIPDDYLGATLVTSEGHICNWSFLEAVDEWANIILCDLRQHASSAATEVLNMRQAYGMFGYAAEAGLIDDVVYNDSRQHWRPMRLDKIWNSASQQEFADLYDLRVDVTLT